MCVPAVGRPEKRERSALSSSAPRPAGAGVGDSSLKARVESLRMSRDVRSTGGRIAWVPWLLCFAFLGTTLWLWPRAGGMSPGMKVPTTALKPSTGGNSGASSGAGAGANKNEPATTEGQQAAAGEIALEAKGWVVPRHQILVSPKVSGMIMELNIEEGRHVEKGEVLAILENTEYIADRDKAKAMLELATYRLLELKNGSRPDEIKQVEAELEEAKTQLANLEGEWRRQQELKEKKFTSQSAFEEAKSQYLAMARKTDRLTYALQLMREGPRQERIDAARAEVGQAESDLTKAEWRLSNCTIRAPISGTILKKNAEEGNIVNPIAFNGSFSVCDIADLGDMEADLTIDERDVSKLFQGQKCKLRPEAYPDRTYTGTVSRLMPIADRAKGGLPVRVKIDIPKAEEGMYLRPEMGVIVSFLRANEAKVPESAALPVPKSGETIE